MKKHWLTTETYFFKDYTADSRTANEVKAALIPYDDQTASNLTFKWSLHRVD